MRLERAGQREFAELVTDHVLGDINGHKGLAIVDVERVADEVRRDGGSA